MRTKEKQEDPDRLDKDYHRYFNSIQIIEAYTGIMPLKNYTCSFLVSNEQAFTFKNKAFTYNEIVKKVESLIIEPTEIADFYFGRELLFSESIPDKLRQELLNKMETFESKFIINTFIRTSAHIKRDPRSASIIQNLYYNLLDSSDVNSYLNDENKTLIINTLKLSDPKGDPDEWDQTSSLIQAYCKSDSQRRKEAFDKLLWQNHYTGNILDISVKEEDVSKSNMLIAVRNSGKYGLKKFYENISDELRETLKNIQGNRVYFELSKLFGAKNDLDIRRTLPSVLKGANLSQKYSLAKSIYENENDIVLKETFYLCLVSEGINIKQFFNGIKSGIYEKYLDIKSTNNSQIFEEYRRNLVRQELKNLSGISNKEKQQIEQSVIEYILK